MLLEPAMQRPRIEGVRDAVSPVLIVAAVGVLAVAAAVSFGWLFAIGILGAAVILRWPVASSLGLVAFLLPFDNISSLGSDASGVTLTRLVAAMAAAVLLALG